MAAFQVPHSSYHDKSAGWRLIDPDNILIWYNDDKKIKQSSPPAGSLLDVGHVFIFRDAHGPEVINYPYSIAISLGMIAIDPVFEVEMLCILTTKGIGWITSRTL
jgi:hypothetical protein